MLALTTLGAVVPGTPASAAAFPAADDAETDLYLVTLEGPGTAGRDAAGDDLPGWWREVEMRVARERALDAVEAPAPLYTWTTALHGVAVELDAEQAEALAEQPGVALVERDALRPLAAAPTRTPAGAAAPAAGAAASSRGGAGTVIGVVDTGLAPESRAFAAAPGLGRMPAGFRGSCAEEQGAGAVACTSKVVAAQWFVAGFGEENLRSAAVLSARDTDGHGTQAASIAAGNADVAVRDGQQELGTFSGQAPRARLAVYKACWSAPDPVDDGCSSADLVSAVDRATRDGVDVLNLSVGGSGRLDTLERALLGAAEADVVVVAAAGNDGARATVGHVGPWVTTVGAASSPARRGDVVATAGGPRLTGAMVSTRAVGPAPAVLAAAVRTPGATPRQARTCAPGSLDAARTSGRVVVCERGGGVGRVEKSRTVRLADGVGMVLVNERPGSVAEDLHAVPTVHLDRADGERLLAWLRRTSPAEARLRLLPRAGAVEARRGVTRWSARGSADGTAVKPDLVAAGTGILAALPPDDDGAAWGFVSGTSAAAARTAGAAAVVRSARPELSAAQVRSALATTAAPMPGAGVLDAGSGVLRPDQALAPGLVHDVDPGDYRAWLEEQPRDRAGTDLNSPSVRLAGTRGGRAQERTVTNLGRRTFYYSSRVEGLRGSVRVTPAALALAPGESATYRVERVGPAPRRPDDGWVVWRGARGSVTRVPVLVGR
ncbi:hypothetical protein GCM10023226_08950 [Nocardioides nanhaiensis]|uniref:Peptidase S8/S53 domain-containing protein n=1 Tax=Nocardioides nanhaiensis TaxID=1476871 RepID=A0ABP8VWP4_9ACTN